MDDPKKSDKMLAAMTPEMRKSTVKLAGKLEDLSEKLKHTARSLRAAINLGTGQTEASLGSLCALGMEFNLGLALLVGADARKLLLAVDDILLKQGKEAVFYPPAKLEAPASKLTLQ